MSDNSESNTSITKQFRWIAKFQTGSASYSNNRTSAGPRWFATEEEAEADAEKNAENQAKDYPDFKQYDGYDITTNLSLSNEERGYEIEDSDISSSSGRFYEDSVPSEDSRGLVLDTSGDCVPAAVGKRKFEEESPRDKKVKSEDYPASKKVDSGDGLKLLKSTTPISIKLGIQKSKENTAILKKTSSSVHKAFNPDTDSEEEEMPPEAKMRMRNIGRDTPTSAGPNSFGKTRQGFCDTKKVWERKMKEKIREVSDDN